MREFRISEMLEDCISFTKSEEGKYKRLRAKLAALESKLHLHGSAAPIGFCRFTRMGGRGTNGS